MRSEHDTARKNIEELEELVYALNKNRAGLEERIAGLNRETERRQLELQEISDSNRQLSEARKSGIQTLKSMVTDI